MFQSLAVKVRAVEAAGASAPDDTFPSPSSPLVTVTVTGAVGWLASVTVKAAAASSSTVNHGAFASSGTAGSSTRAASSSSVIVKVRSAGFAAPLETPDTVTFLPAEVASTIESTSSSTAVIVTVPVLAIVPVGMTKVVPDNVKSSAAAFVPADAATVIVVGAFSATVRYAVTVAVRAFAAAAALSSIVFRDNDSVTSVGVPVTSDDAAPSDAFARVAITRTV